MADEDREPEDVLMNHILVALLQKMGGIARISSEEHSAVHTGGGVIDIGVWDEDGSIEIKLIHHDRKFH